MKYDLIYLSTHYYYIHIHIYFQFSHMNLLKREYFFQFMHTNEAAKSICQMYPLNIKETSNIKDKGYFCRSYIYIILKYVLNIYIK